MRRRPLLLLLLVALLTLGSGTVAAKPLVTTDVSRATHVTGPLLYFQHCRPELGQYTVTVDLQLTSHVTAAGVEEGEVPGEPGDLIPPYHLSFATTGTIDLVPQIAGQPVFTGHIGVRQVEHDLGPGEVIASTGRTVLHGSDGSKVTSWSIFHLTMTPQGKLAVNFGESECSTS